MPASNGHEAAITQSRVHTLKSGKRIELGRLGLQDFVQCKEQALHEYKRELIKTWTLNADLLPEEMRDSAIKEAFQRAQEIHSRDLPKMTAQMPVVENGRFKRDEDGQVVTTEAEIPYEGWWTSQTPEGMLYATWLSMRRCEGQRQVTLDDADEIFRDAQEDLQEAAGVVGELSDSALTAEMEGNSPTPEPTQVGNTAPGVASTGRSSSETSAKPTPV